MHSAQGCCLLSSQAVNDKKIRQIRPEHAISSMTRSGGLPHVHLGVRGPRKGPACAPGPGRSARAVNEPPALAVNCGERHLTRLRKDRQCPALLFQLAEVGTLGDTCQWLPRQLQAPRPLRSRLRHARLTSPRPRFLSIDLPARLVSTVTQA